MMSFTLIFFIFSSFSLFLIILIYQYRSFKRERIRVSQIGKKHKIISKRITKRMVKNNQNEISRRIGMFCEQYFRLKHTSPFGFMRWKMRFSRVLSFVKKTSNVRILDVGCSDGFLILYTTKMGLESIGLDISKDLLKKAKERFGNKGLCFLGVVADAAHLPFKEESFSTIFCLDVLEHLPDEDNCLKEVYRALERRGDVIITTPCATSMNRTINVFEFLYKLRAIITRNSLPKERPLCSKLLLLTGKKEPYIFHRDFTPYELKKKCKISGFCITHFHTYDYTTVNHIVSKIHNMTRSLSLSKTIVMCLTRLLSTLPYVKYLGRESIVVYTKLTR